MADQAGLQNGMVRDLSKRNFWQDYPSSLDVVPTLRPEQLNLQNQLIGQAGTLSKDLSQNKFNFAPIEQRAREQFQTQTIPSLAERFTGQGGGLRSSAFQGALGSAGANLETNLAALRQDYGLKQQELQQSHLKNLLGYSQAPSIENFYTPSKPGPLEQAFTTAAPKLIEEGVKYGGGKFLDWWKGENKKDQTKTAGGAAAGGEAAQSTGEAIGEAAAGVGGAAALASTPAAAKGTISWLAAKTGFSPDQIKALGHGSIMIGTAIGLGLYVRYLNQQGEKEEAAEAQRELEQFDQWQKEKAQGENKVPKEYLKLPNESLQEYLIRIRDLTTKNREQRGQ